MTEKQVDLESPVSPVDEKSNIPTKSYAQSPNSLHPADDKQQPPVLQIADATGQLRPNRGLNTRPTFTDPHSHRPFRCYSEVTEPSSQRPNDGLGLEGRYTSREDTDDETDYDYPAKSTERKLVGRIDLHVMPFLCLMYMMAFLDRVNISNANSFGLSEELGLKSHNEYNISLIIFFIPYILLEIPSNYLLKKLRPNYWLGGCMLLFGLTTLLQGLVKSFSALLVTRFFLGVFEAGMFPGAFYLIGMWYRRHEAQRRFSFFFSSTTIAGAFGGLLASVFGMLDGELGKRGWRWIFLIEGLITALFGIVCLFWLPTFPEEAHWLSKQELAYVRTRIRTDQGIAQAQSSVKLKCVINVLRDRKIILGGFMYFGLLVSSYSYAYFAPTIIRADYNFKSGIATQLYSAPPWVVAAVVAMGVAYLSDRLRHRFLFVIFLQGISAVGLITLLCVTHHKNVQYGALFLVAIGVYSALPIVVCWFNMNLGGHLRRSIGCAWQISFGNVGGIIAGFAFLPKDAPYFRLGYAICLGFLVLSAMTSSAYYYSCRRDNIEKDRNPHRTLTMSVEEMERLGDLNPEYRYLL